MASIQFVVEGVPVPQGSKNAWVNKKTNKAVMFDQNVEKLRPWRQLVASAAQAAQTGEQFEGAVFVRVEFRLIKPKTVKRLWPSVKPDVDKLVRSVLDGITASALFKDDAQVVSLIATKVYADRPGARIEVGLLADAHEGEK